MLVKNFYILLLSLKSEIKDPKLLLSKATILFQKKSYSAYSTLSLIPCFVIEFPSVHTTGIRNYINCPNLAERIPFLHDKSNVCDVWRRLFRTVSCTIWHLNRTQPLTGKHTHSTMTRHTSFAAPNQRDCRAEYVHVNWFTRESSTTSACCHCLLITGE